MEKISSEDKKAIVARNFYTDNQEGEEAYDNYEQALKEISEGTSEKFIEFAVQPYVKREPGCRLLMKEGHVISVREEDGFVDPRTEMTEKEGEDLLAAFTKIADEHPNVQSGIVLLQKLGWKLL